MNNTKEEIMLNLTDALSYKDYSLDEAENKLLNKVLSSHLESFKTWRLRDYLDFASTVISENLRYALREYDLLSPADLGLPFEDVLCKYIVTFDGDNQNLQDEFDSRSSAFQYAKDNVENLPCVTSCYQTDVSIELGYGDDYEEEEITREDPELAELLDEYI